jgi:hypothetical protein
LLLRFPGSAIVLSTQHLPLFAFPCRQGICCYVILKAGVEETPALAAEMKSQVGRERGACSMLELPRTCHMRLVALTTQVRKVIGPFATPDYVVLTPVRVCRRPAPPPPLASCLHRHCRVYTVVVSTPTLQCLWHCIAPYLAVLCVSVPTLSTGPAQDTQWQDHAPHSPQGHLTRGEQPCSLHSNVSPERCTTRVGTARLALPRRVLASLSFCPWLGLW